ncbi:MAG: hypothetical protein IJT98_11535 [Prevotella sp.]|nr:hypothetical protein [Prevotella sp.]
MTEKGYPFVFVGIDTSITDDYQKDALLYRFESEKSHHHYLVRIERYVKGLHCIKFFDETTDASKGSFSHLSATYEPRSIFRTIVDIALDVLRKNPKASFMYIGAADEKDAEGRPTRRYRVYQMYMTEFDVHDLFEPADFISHSMSLLVNLLAMPTEDERKNFREEVARFIGFNS